MVVIQIVRPLLRCGHWPALDGAHLQSSSRWAGLLAGVIVSVCAGDQTGQHVPVRPLPPIPLAPP